MLMLGTVFPPVWTVIFGANVLVVYIVPILLSWTINSKCSLLVMGKMLSWLAKAYKMCCSGWCVAVRLLGEL